MTKKFFFCFLTGSEREFILKIISNFYNKNLAFGYDKKLNAELKQSLSAYPDRKWANTLSSINSSVNRIEDNLQFESQNKKKDGDSRYSDYLDLFLSLKQLLAGFVTITFDNLNFADREFIHYYDEYVKNGSNKGDWRIDACEALKDWTSGDFLINLPKSSEKKVIDPSQQIYIPKFDENGVEIIDTPSAQPKTPDDKKLQEIKDKAISALSPKSFLEEFKPTKHSPKGFQDVAGMDDLKRDLQEGIIMLLNDPEQAQIDFEEYGKSIPRGILLYGPPGCGKTYITQALAAEAGVPLYMLNISKAGSHYINMTSKNIKAAFDEVISIADKSGKPCLLFMDEIDTMAFDRNSRMEPDDLKQVGTILQAMDEAKEHNVIIIGATNKYNILDPAVKRRFDSKSFVDIPDEKSIKSLLEKNLLPLKKGQKLLADDESLNAVVKLLHGYSNSSICNISKEAALCALHRGRADISVDDYKKAIDSTGEEKPDRKEYMSESKNNQRKIGFGA